MTASLVAVLATSSIPSGAGGQPDDGTTSASASAAPVREALDEAIPAAPPAVVVATATRPGAAGLHGAGRPSVEDIPPAALAAYQRAALVMASADKTCGLAWELLAAIGRVESDHGRYDGNQLDEEGVARPGVLGPRLTGRHHTRRILDTDGGELDGDVKFDRAVGPMQFIPATWANVVVDGDADGRRDPQDIDDAALAAAVYLCSGTEDLTTVRGERAAVHRYNRSRAYVDLVLAVKRAYESGFGTTTALRASVALSAVQSVAARGSSVSRPPAGEPAPLPASKPAAAPTEPAPAPSPAPPAPAEPTPTTDPVPTDPVPTTDPTPADPVVTDPPPAEPTGNVDDVLTATRDDCVAGGVEGGDSTALASCLADRLVLVIGEDGTIVEARAADAGDVRDAAQEAAEVTALVMWLDRHATQ